MKRLTLSVLVLCCCWFTGAAPAQIVTMTNDECATAMTVFDGINPSAPGGLSGNVFTNTGAMTSAGPAMTCVSSFSKDVWFQYTATGTGAATFSTCTPAGFAAGTLNDSVLQLCSSTAGACPALASLGCSDTACAPDLSTVSYNVTLNSVYFIRVASWSGSGDGTFYLSITAPTPPPPPPANDECTGAVALARGVNPATGFFTNVGATNSAGFNAPCGFTNVGFADVFFTYTPPCNAAVTVSTCPPAGYPQGTNGDTTITIFLLSDCPGPPAPAIACNDDSGCGLTGLGGYLTSVGFSGIGGTTYLIRVANYDYGGPSSFYFPGTFYVTVTATTATKSQLGLGCSDGGGAGPTLDLDAAPVLGATRTLSIAGAVPGSPGMMFMSQPAPFLGLPGNCTLYVDSQHLMFFVFVLTNGAGDWSMTGTVPSDPALECGTLWLQGVVFPPSGTPYYQVTSGLNLVLGY